MKTNHRITLVDSIDFGETVPKYGRAISLSELNHTSYDLRINLGRCAHAYLTSKSVAEIGKFLSELKESGLAVGGVYACPSPEVLTGAEVK